MGEILKEQTLLRQGALFVEVLITLQKKIKIIKQEKQKSRAAGASYNRQMERTPQKCFRYGSEDHIIAKFPNPPKDNEKR